MYDSIIFGSYIFNFFEMCSSCNYTNTSPIVQCFIILKFEIEPTVSTYYSNRTYFLLYARLSFVFSPVSSDMI